MCNHFFLCFVLGRSLICVFFVLHSQRLSKPQTTWKYTVKYMYFFFIIYCFSYLLPSHFKEVIYIPNPIIYHLQFCRFQWLCPFIRTLVVQLDSTFFWKLAALVLLLLYFWRGNCLFVEGFYIIINVVQSGPLRLWSSTHVHQQTLSYLTVGIFTRHHKINKCKYIF